MSKYGWLQQKKHYLDNPPPHTRHLQGQIIGDFGVLVTLTHAMELLMSHGLRPFTVYLNDLLSDSGRVGCEWNSAETSTAPCFERVAQK